MEEAHLRKKVTNMNPTTSLIVSSIIVPATIVVGLSAPVALSISAIAGVLSIAFQDYGARRMTYLESAHPAAKTEKHALAA